MSRGALVVVACLGLAIGASPAHGDEPAPDLGWKERGARRALETRDIALAPLALRTLADLHVLFFGWWGQGNMKLLADHPEVREALEYAERAEPFHRESSVWERWKQDGYAASSDECAALERWRRSSNRVEMLGTVQRELGQPNLLPPAGARAEDWYYCLGVWDEASVDTLLAKWDSQWTSTVFAAVQPVVRAYAASRLLVLLASAPPERRGRWIDALGKLGHASPEVIAQLDLATAVPKLQAKALEALEARAALAALAALVPRAPKGSIAEERVIEWARKSDGKEGGFIAVSPRLQAQLAAKISDRKLASCEALPQLPEGSEAPAPIVDAVLALLAAKDAKLRRCGEQLGYQLVANAPRLIDPLVKALRATPEQERRVAPFLALSAGGAASQLVPELAALYQRHGGQPPDDLVKLSEQLAGVRLEDAAKAELRPALLSYMKAQAPGWQDDSIGPALLNVGPISALEALDLLERTHGGDANLRVSDIHQLRFWAIVASGGDPIIVHAARWFASRSRQPAPRDPAEARATIKATLEVLDRLKPAKVGVSSLNAPPALPDVDGSALALLRTLLDDARWTAADEPFLRGLLDLLPDTPEMAAIRAAVQRRLTQLGPAVPPAPPLATRIIRLAVTLFGTHFLIWLALLVTVYPRSRTLQVAMLFNPLGRAVTGLGYTQLLMLVSPWLRRRLFHPLVDAGRDTEVVSYDAASFYDQIRVAPLLPRKNPQAPVELLPPIAWTELAKLEGVVVIEGASGLGKTHVLKALLERSRKAGRTCLFVRAAECNAGVLKEIEDRLALEHSSGFVRSMIYRGAIELFLDGLNEAKPSGVAEIAQFCERALYARIFITTQPMSWPCPRRARQFRLLPLEPNELEAFLMAQWPAVKMTPPADEDDEAAKQAYQARVQAFLATRTAPRDLAVLQNRIDLAFVAHLLARAEVPNIHSLRKQVVDDAASAYEAASPGGAFPLAELGAAAVRVLESGNPVIESEGLDPAVLAQLAERKLLLHRGASDWLFRHDTITCYFAAQGVFAPLVTADAVDPRAVTDAHLSSPRFVGVYLQLAESLPLAAAEHLATALRDHGRDSHDRALEIAYQDLLDRRAG